MEWRSAGFLPVPAESIPAYFINQSLLLLAALAVIPIILHFLLRHKPKKLLFPALRLIQLRKKNNVRRLRLKHIWLLLLRIALIVLLVLALARPTLPAANYAPSGFEWFTILGLVALAIVVYFGVLTYWRRQRIPNHVLTYRRSILRGGTGAGLLVLFLLLFVWPYSRRVFAEINAPLPDVAKNLPVSATFLFDTGLTMDYTPQKQNRLQAAAEIAKKHLRTFNSGSQVAVATTAGSGAMQFTPDLKAVEDRIDKLKVNPIGGTSLISLINAAIRKQVSDRKQALEEFEADRYLREVYLFTDLTANALDGATSGRLREELEKHPWLQIYLIDVGIREPSNVAVTDVSLSQSSVVQSEDLYIDVKLKAVGEKRTKRTLQLSFFDNQGVEVKADRAAVTLEPGVDIPHRFVVRNLTGPFRQGKVSIDSNDPLKPDDVRYFTVAVHPRPRVLIVSDSRSDAFLWRQALAPENLPPEVRWFECTYLPGTKLTGVDLAKYDVVYLINVSEPTAAMWTALEKYANGGGGVGVALGVPYSDGTLRAYQSAEALKILPGKPLAQLKFAPPEYLELYKRQHPIFQTYRKAEPDKLTNAQIKKYWRVQPAEKADIIARYTDTRHVPAILSRTIKQGRTLLITTAINQKVDWNLLAFSGWQYQDLAHHITNFLTGRAAHSYNFQRGQPVRVYWDRRKTARPKLLRKPHAQISVESKQNKVSRDDQLGAVSILFEPAEVDAVGNYQVIGDDPSAKVLTAFSYNLSPRQSDLTRLTTEQLDELFGPKRYQIARDTETLKRVVQAGRLGEEVFKYVLAIVLLIFCGELFVGNRFYEADQAAQHA